MTNERAKQILCMSEQEAWRSGITLEEHKEAISVAVKALEMKQNRGEWIESKHCSDWGDQLYNCSVCGYQTTNYKQNYCSFCGSDNRRK